MSKINFDKYLAQDTIVSFLSKADFNAFDVIIYFFCNNEFPRYVNSEFVCTSVKSTHYWAVHNEHKNLAVLLYDIGLKNDEFIEKEFLTKISSVVEIVNGKKLKNVLFDFTNIFYKLFVFGSNIPGQNNTKVNDFVQNLTMVLLLTNYEFDIYKTEKKSFVQKFSLLIDSYQSNLIDDMNALCIESKIVSQCSILSRNLSNERADVAHPLFFDELSNYLFNGSKSVVEIEVLSGGELKEMGLNLFYAVGQGAVNIPKLVCIKYIGDKDNSQKFISLVGKGVTYDTGGLNLKPTNCIENMHLDKSGACAVIAAMKAIVDTGVKINVIGILGLAENAIGSKAYKPFSIIKSLHGKTVRVANTDAEGRLVLADCLTWVQNKYNPHTIIDLATLTGSCVGALGENYCGVFGNNRDLIESIIEVGEKKYERGHILPLEQEHRDELICVDADLNSMGGKYAGASTAAAFLSEFVSSHCKWVHLDIAGPAMRARRKNWFCENGTGFGVQLIYFFVKKISVE
jgi:leucyl aminopeptidase